MALITDGMDFTNDPESSKLAPAEWPHHLKPSAVLGPVVHYALKTLLLSSSGTESFLWNPNSKASRSSIGDPICASRNMEENYNSSSNSLGHEETLKKEAPQLVALLKEMKEGLDVVRSKVQALTVKVKENHFPTADGISYLEAKHLLLLSYCQSIVYYLLRKAKGLSIDGHPVVRSLVEIRLFLEKIRPIDKKLQYQVQKLTRVASNVSEKVGPDENENNVSKHTTEDPLKYRPNPDMLTSKLSQAAEDHQGVYRPPKFAPTTMDEDKISKQEKLAMRREKETLRQAKQSAYVKELMDDFEGRPEEVREIIGAESKELLRYKAKMEDRARQEEELFTRAPISKLDKKKEKHLRKSRNGLLSLTDGFSDEIKALPLEEDDSKPTEYTNMRRERRKNYKRKAC